MKKKILLTATTLTLIMTGCAQKKLNTTDDMAGAIDGTGTAGGTYVMENGANSGVVTGSEVYENVDPYGSGNGEYANGQYGRNGQYSMDGNGYGASGVQNIYFNVDQYHISADKLGKISRNAKLLREAVNSGARVKVEGHCDASGSDEYNYALGLRRAKATKDALKSNGINDGSITLVSMGESAPECTSGSSSECYSQNRRVEFKVVQ
jgi:outer membrane protein OmpA-like peptidoglycan-associated protein